MKKLKLDPVQKFKIQMALNLSSQVLREIKAISLTGQALDDMKTLEGAVQGLEAIQLAD